MKKKDQRVSDQPEKMNLESMDVSAEKRDAMKQLFPEVFTEDNIDFDALRRTLGNIVEGGKERFGLNWAGKADCMKVIQAPSVATLKPCRNESVDFDTTENLFVEGDNLEVLKLLQKSYFGKVKMIYIDPPYNTGNEFIYPYKYQENLDTYMEYTGQKDAEGRTFATNADTAGRYHSNWLNMMYPRLYLAKNLLKEDGMIFISIDDNEQTNLRLLCDQIYGEENFVAQFLWKSRQTTDSRKNTKVSTDHEYVICYSKNIECLSFTGKDIDKEKYKNPDKDPRGPWASENLSVQATKDQRPNQFYSITDPVSGLSYPANPNRVWAKSKPVVEQMIKENRILFPSSPEGRPREKKFLNDLTSEKTGFSSWLNSVEVGYTTTGTKDLSRIFEERFFDFPKPMKLISTLINQGTESDSIVLDFFSGSSTTANAVINSNNLDGGNRKFIMVQLPEPCDKKSAAQRAGFKTIADIGKERIRRAGTIIKAENEGTFDLDGSAGLDIGFKVFQLDTSNFKIWDGDADNFSEEQFDMHVDHVGEAAEAEDILYELLLKSGFDLTTPIEQLTMADKQVYSIADGALLICLDKNLNGAVIDAIAAADPIQVICLDEGFKGNDQLKANTVQTFASRAAASESEIVFRTVQGEFS